MEEVNYSPEESKEGFTRTVIIRSEAILNMVGVILFYVVVFVAFSVFSN
ncbi:MAG: hypothetical protein ABI763_09660 [Bacteroidota bacterium]